MRLPRALRVWSTELADGNSYGDWDGRIAGASVRELDEPAHAQQLFMCYKSGSFDCRPQIIWVGYARHCFIPGESLRAALPLGDIAYPPH